MTVEVLSVNPPRKSSSLANVKVRLMFDEGHIVDIDDIRVLRNNRGELWTALPTFSLQDGKFYRYEKTVDCSKGVWRKIDDAVQEAFEKWSANQTAVRP